MKYYPSTMKSNQKVLPYQFYEPIPVRTRLHLTDSLRYGLSLHYLSIDEYRLVKCQDLRSQSPWNLFPVRFEEEKGPRR